MATCAPGGGSAQPGARRRCMRGHARMRFAARACRKPRAHDISRGARHRKCAASRAHVRNTRAWHHAGRVASRVYAASRQPASVAPCRPAWNGRPRPLACFSCGLHAAAPTASPRFSCSLHKRAPSLRRLGVCRLLPCLAVYRGLPAPERLLSARVRPNARAVSMSAARPRLLLGPGRTRRADSPGTRLGTGVCPRPATRRKQRREKHARGMRWPDLWAPHPSREAKGPLGTTGDAPEPGVQARGGAE